MKKIKNEGNTGIYNMMLAFAGIVLMLVIAGFIISACSKDPDAETNKIEQTQNYKVIDLSLQAVAEYRKSATAVYAVAYDAGNGSIMTAIIDPESKAWIIEKTEGHNKLCVSSFSKSGIPMGGILLVHVESTEPE